MTWTWRIDGLGTVEQTLRVFDSDGTEVFSETREGWTWEDNCPRVVEENADTWPSNIERVQK